ncbi:MAG: metallophosphoesterase [Phycisphaerae bacterium]
MKLLYASDLHGLPQRFEGVSAAAEAVRPDAIVLGGDLFADEASLAPDRAGRQQPEYVRGSFQLWLERMLAAHPSVEIGVVFGNHDWITSVAETEKLAERLPLVILDGWSRTDDATPSNGQPGVHWIGLRWIGYSFTPPTPWHVKDFELLDQPDDSMPEWDGYQWDAELGRAVKREVASIFGPRRTLAGDLRRLTSPNEPWILVAHCPPFDCALDRLEDGKPYGSRAVRRVIEQHHPFLGLHGHFHGSPDFTGRHVEHIGQTQSVNVGQPHSGAATAVIDLDEHEGLVRRIDRRVTS